MNIHSDPLEPEPQGRYKGIWIGSGKIVKGTLNEAPQKFKVGSIPTKTQNAIEYISRIPAFGNSIPRFCLSKDFMPGPGAYTQLNTSQLSVSSKKGTGSFASSTNLSRNTFSFIRGSGIPGPGSYRLQSLRSKAHSLTNLAKATPHHIFTDQIQRAKLIPSPTQYDKSRIMQTTLPNKMSAFTSQTVRFRSNSNDVPAVGTYAVDPILVPKGVKRPNIQINFPAAQTNSSVQAALILLDAKIQSSPIGPGSYELPSRQPKGFSISQGTHNRFGELKEVYAIAKAMTQEMSLPVDDKPQRPIITKPQPMSSVFASKSERELFRDAQLSDPTKYSPQKQKNKSHFVNYCRKWV